MGLLRALFGGLFGGNSSNNRRGSFDSAVAAATEGFTFKAHVDVRSFCPEYPGRGYSCSYAVYDSIGNVRLVIEVLPHNGEKYADYKSMVAACAKRNVKVVTFYTHLPNEYEYVVNRIRAAL
jgi:hypothetical protein